MSHLAYLRSRPLSLLMLASNILFVLILAFQPAQYWTTAPLVAAHLNTASGRYGWAAALLVVSLFTALVPRRLTNSGLLWCAGWHFFFAVLIGYGTFQTNRGGLLLLMSLVSRAAVFILATYKRW